MIVGSNTSPLTNLAAIGKFDLLRQLYGKILIPEAVWDELNYRGEAWPGSKEVENADWIVKQKVENRHLIQALIGDLERGEAECIIIVFIVRLCKETGLETIQ